MNQRQREKIALVVFLALIVIAISGSIWYMNIGHQWNKTATVIDDATGSLENYTVLVFDGLAVPNADTEAGKKPRTLQSAVAEYTDKRANVVPLDLVNRERYSQGTIIKAGQRRIGLFSVFTRAEASAYQNIVASFENEAVDFIVCITSDGSLLQGSEGLQGIDIAITTEPLSDAFKGQRGSVYLVQSPAVGKIGVIFVSPSNVVSDKILTSN